MDKSGSRGLIRRRKGDTGRELSQPNGKVIMCDYVWEFCFGNIQSSLRFSCTFNPANFGLLSAVLIFILPPKQTKCTCQRILSSFLNCFMSNVTKGLRLSQLKNKFCVFSSIILTRLLETFTKQRAVRYDIRNCAILVKRALRRIIWWIPSLQALRTFQIITNFLINIAHISPNISVLGESHAVY